MRSRRTYTDTAYFNPRSPRGERPIVSDQLINDSYISIHAPLAGSDATADLVCGVESISIHAPLAGSDPACTLNSHSPHEFQSTLPSRGATSYRVLAVRY